MRRPDYALGPHVAPLGLVFANQSSLGSAWNNGAIVALHGSWNRSPLSGYKVVYVKFDEHGRPLNAPPVDLLTGFLGADSKTTRGRPTDVKLAKDGALLVTDDTAGIVWRVSGSGAASGTTSTASPAATSASSPAAPPTPAAKK